MIDDRPTNIERLLRATFECLLIVSVLGFIGYKLTEENRLAAVIMLITVWVIGIGTAILRFQRSGQDARNSQARRPSS